MLSTCVCVYLIKVVQGHLKWNHAVRYGSISHRFRDFWRFRLWVKSYMTSNI